MKRTFWTTHELALVREHFPAGGVPACLPHLPGRTRTSIWQQARRLGVRSPRQKVSVRECWPNDDHIDQQIRFAHQQAPTRGSVGKLAERLGRPTWWVSRRARELGLMTPRFREPEWSPEELAIIDATEHRRPETARMHLLKAGYKRSLTAVTVRRKRLGIRVPERVGEYSAAQVGVLLGYEPATVARWVRMGLLQAKRLADEYLINDKQVRAFLTSHPMQVDLRRLPLGNRPWLIELLSGVGACTVDKAVAG